MSEKEKKMPDKAEDTKLYTTAEIMLATGLQRGTITNRVVRLGFKRNGTGYTAEQIFKIVTVPLQIHRKSEENAMELRERLNSMIAESNLPIGIVQNGSGEWTMEIRNGGDTR